MFEIKEYVPVIEPEPWTWLINAGETYNREDVEKMMVLWIEDVLNGLLYNGVKPEDIMIEQKKIGRFHLPIVSVKGERRYLFHPYMEKCCA